MDAEESVPHGDLVNLPFPDAAEAIRSSPSLVSSKDSHERTLLHHAAEAGRADVVDLLLGLQADPNVRDDVGRTPLHWAANCGDLRIVAQLLACGADANLEDAEGMTPLMWAAISRSGHGNEVKEMLMRHGAER